MGGLAEKWPAQEAAVELRQVRKVFTTRGDGEIEAVANASFSVTSGELLAVLGPSGCGKSTLLMMIAGLENPTAGEILIGGTPVTGPSAHTGIVFQEATLLPWLGVLDNVLYPGRIRHLDLDVLLSRALDLLELVGLEEFLNTKPAQLSGGMRQRVAICRALVYDPALLLMDEPFSALDAITRDEMGELLLALWESMHKSGILVTHSIREALLLADRVLVMGKRPAQLVADIRVPFPRPRDISLVDTPEFAELSGELRNLIGGTSDGRAKRLRSRFSERLAWAGA